MRTTIALLAGLATAAPALACSCMRPGPDAPQPEIIVTAQVEAISRADNGLVARLRVISRERGRTPRRIDVHTAAHSAACGVDFQKGAVARYALSRHLGRYSANSCMQFLMNQRTRPTIQPE